MNRGQTTLDFAIAISLFLLTISFVFTFIPGLLEPFDGGTQSDTVTADRVADQLAEGFLGNPNTPYLLDTACTRAFFDDRSPSDCTFTGSSLHERVGLASSRNAQVVLRGNVSGGSGDGWNVLCWDDDAATLVEVDDGCNAGDDIPFRAGESPPTSSGSVITAKRSVSIRNTDGILMVRVW